MTDTYEIVLSVSIRKVSDNEYRVLSENNLQFFGLDAGDMAKLQEQLPPALAGIWLALQRAANSDSKVT